ADAGASLARRGGSAPVPFRLGEPAVDAFPTALWARLTARRWRAGTIGLGEGDPAGDPALRAAIATHVTAARGARCTAEQVLVVSGTQQALDLAARVLLDPGDAVWIEDPGYRGARAAFAAAGARLVPVPVDGEGLDVAAGEAAAPGARLAYVTPSHQFPLGAVMSAPRRLALLAWARRADAWVVEDDYDSEFRYGGRPLPCLQGLDAERRAPGESARVVYVGTFNKTLAPGLRMGYVVVPDALADAMRAARAASDRFAPTIAQGVLADFIGEGHYARHVRRARAAYAERQAALLEAAARELDALLALAPDAAGLHLVGRLPAGVRDVDAVAAASAAGVEVAAVSDHALADGAARVDGRDALLLSYAGFDARALRAGVRVLRRAQAARAASRIVAMSFCEP
ncbi:PLP-dependent aminotransferase family protein, partial [Roseisolibacter sp. H3M3-2]|uniref:MocR-like pyridoxine biosynthesis transcription factor PdxR n=1 Tax=Roseisolibacter sp. H3M3-2 TaxID=3031323 RepID=UPI0023DABAB1